jgi:hypothetical protein
VAEALENVDNFEEEEGVITQPQPAEEAENPEQNKEEEESETLVLKSV